jgi:hypothetical protein
MALRPVVILHGMMIRTASRPARHHDPHGITARTASRPAQHHDQHGIRAS